MVKKICILTKSVKDRAYCVAGIDVGTGKWIRLVSSKSGEAVSKELFDDKKNPINVLDVVAVNLIEHIPQKCQTENWLLDVDAPIIGQGRLTMSEVLRIRKIDTPQFIFANDKAELTADDVKRLNHSLLAVEVFDIVFDTSLKGDGRHHHKVSFIYMGNEYTICLTDPDFRKEELDKFKLKKAILIVSIPCEPYGENDLYYKFAAKIFTREL
ncbi:MAG: hypothetical protein FWE84_01285 [Firmicutes bacterium]|nr:hypothetical protein [Bacillota bacterium]